MGRKRKTTVDSPAPGEKKPNTTPPEGTPAVEKNSQGMVRIAPDLGRKINKAASILDTTVSKLLDPIIRDFIERTYAEAARKMMNDVEPSLK